LLGFSIHSEVILLVNEMPMCCYCAPKWQTPPAAALFYIQYVCMLLKFDF
jgi:hypothetical protein